MAIRTPRPRPQKARLPAPRPKDVSKYHGARMTAEEYLSLPEEKPYLEFVDGVVLQKPMVNANHRNLVGEVDFQFGLYKRARGGHYGPESTVELDDSHFRLPDTGYWAPGVPSGDHTLPTLAVEVLSPSQTMEELRAKCAAFRRSGVVTCWLIDPDARTAEVFEGETSYALPADGKLESSALPGLSIPVDELFAVLDE